MDLVKLASILDEIKTTTLLPTDVLVFKTAGTETLNLLQKAELTIFLVEVTQHERVVILDGGAELAILRTEEDPGPAPAAASPAPQPPTAPVGPKRGTAPGAIA